MRNCSGSSGNGEGVLPPGSANYDHDPRLESCLGVFLKNAMPRPQRTLVGTARPGGATDAGRKLPAAPRSAAIQLNRSSSIRLKQVWAGQELSGFCGAAYCLQSGIS